MPTRRRGAVAIAALTLSLLPTRRARADGPGDDATRSEADAEFNEGKKLLDAGDTAAACARFARSQELDPKLGRLLNLAFCHEQEGKMASAWNEYNAAAALAAQKAQPDRVDFAREHANAVSKRLSFLHLDVPAGAEGVQVDGSGVPRERWAMPLPLDPGDHLVVVSAPGKKTRSLTLRVSVDPGVQEFPIAPLEDEAARVSVPASATPPPETPPADEGHASRAPAFVAGGVAIAGIAVGIAAGAVAMSKKSQADPQCPAKECDPAGRALISDAQSAATVSTVGFAVGVAGAAAATWLFLLESSTDAKAARLIPVLGPRHAGLGVEGVF